jgi:hypothetical protein
MSAGIACANRNGARLRRVASNYSASRYPIACQAVRIKDPIQHRRPLCPHVPISKKRVEIQQ